MKRIRLNNDKRNLLWSKAYDLIQDTPVPTASVEKAIAAYEKTFEKAHAAAMKIIDKAVQPDEAKVLRKFGIHFDRKEKHVFTELSDSGSPKFHEFTMFPFVRNEDDMANEQRKAKRLASKGVYTSRSGIDAVTDRKYKLVEKWCPEFPSENFINRISLVADAKTAELIVKTNELILNYRNERKAFDEAMKPVTDAVRALISGAVYFDEVVNYWPEAAQFAHLMADEPSTALSVVSPDALRLIAENMKARGVKIDQKP